MKHIYKNLLYGFAITIGTVSAEAETLFAGALKISAATASCHHSNVGNISNALFHPRAVTGNADFNAMNLFYTFGARSWALYGSDFNSITFPMMLCS